MLQNQLKTVSYPCYSIDKLYYIVMTEPSTTVASSIATDHHSSHNVDNCRHKLIYDHEWVCSLCGRVFSEEEAEELQKGSAEVTSVRSLDSIGLDPHGRTPLWLHGLGSIEGYKHSLQDRERDDISILSNIADKLQLPSHIAVEFLQLYRSFVKEEKDKVPATKLALLLLLMRDNLLTKRVKEMFRTEMNKSDRCKITYQDIIVYVITIVDMQFNAGKRKRENSLYRSIGVEGLERLERLARRYGASRAVSIFSSSFFFSSSFSFSTSSSCIIR